MAPWLMGGHNHEETTMRTIATRARAVNGPPSASLGLRVGVSRLTKVVTPPRRQWRFFIPECRREKENGGEDDLVWSTWFGVRST